MLCLTVPEVEKWDPKKQEFVYSPAQELCLEHSLVSLSKWESKWQKPFLTKEAKTVEESIDYIKCMTLTPDVPQDVYNNFTDNIINTISDYIGNPMTATVVYDEGATKTNREIVTSELIYYWMTMLNIPFECESWHLNRLLMLIRVSSVKNSPSKKMSKDEILRRNAKLNAERKKALNTKG